MTFFQISNLSQFDCVRKAIIHKLHSNGLQYPYNDSFKSKITLVELREVESFLSALNFEGKLIKFANDKLTIKNKAITKFNTLYTDFSNVCIPLVTEKKKYKKHKCSVKPKNEKPTKLVILQVDKKNRFDYQCIRVDNAKRWKDEVPDRKVKYAHQINGYIIAEKFTKGWLYKVKKQTIAKKQYKELLYGKNDKKQKISN